MQKPLSGCRAEGFTLIECLVALAVLAALALGGARLVAQAADAGRVAEERTVGTALAAAKIEELRSLTWRVDPFALVVGVRVSDLRSDLTRIPPGGGGPGLRPSPAAVLTRSTPGYVDYVDSAGRVVGTGAEAPPDARFVRRWAVVPLASDPHDTLVFIAVVAAVADEARRPGDPRHAVRLVSLRSRSRS